MPSFEINKLQSIMGISPTAAAERAKSRPLSEGGPEGSPANGSGPSANASKGAGVAVEINAPVESGPPVDTDRVKEIRSALRDGTYPLVPAKIADAMIAAQLKFEIE